MLRLPLIATRTNTLFPYTTLCRSSLPSAHSQMSPGGAAVATAAGVKAIGNAHVNRAANAEYQPETNRVIPSVWVSGSRVDGRSEEHTSELQSLMRISYAVFCLKKKNTQ